MSEKAYFDELERAMARSDAEEMCEHLDALAAFGGGEWPDEYVDTFGEIIWCFDDDPEKAFAYVILGASRSDDPGFLGLLGCGLLEDLLQAPSDQLLQRIVAEARKSARFRWLLSNPFRVAIAPRAWDAIQKFRITGPHEEPSASKLPPRD